MVTVTGLAGLLAGGWWVTNSPVFDVRSLSVSGNLQLAPGEVSRLGGLGEGTNVLWFSPGAVEARLERSPWVLSADVTRTLPSTIAVSIRERTPVAVLPGRTPLLLAADGTILDTIEPSVSRLPLLEGVPAGLRAGQRISPDTPALLAAAALPPPMRARVETVGLDAEGQLTLGLSGGGEVTYGDATRAAEKGDALLAVLLWA
nr:FtsQ-type POTRA domain-containing protein [Actinomycetota bacterium]